MDVGMVRFFTTETRTVDGAGFYRVRTVDLSDPVLDGDGVQGAWDALQTSLPPGHRVWTWCQLPDPPTPSRCFCCKGPFHISTGSMLGHQRTPFCGACMADFATWLRGHTRRRWRGIRFYDHAGVPG